MPAASAISNAINPCSHRVSGSQKFKFYMLDPQTAPDSRTLRLEPKEMGLFPQLDVRKNFPAVQMWKIWQRVMRRNEDPLGLRVIVCVCVCAGGVDCQEEGKRRWGRKPDSGKWLGREKRTASLPTSLLGSFPNRAARSARAGGSPVPPSSQVVTAQGETSLLPEGQK